MVKHTKARNEPAYIAGLKVLPQSPLGKLELEYRLIDEATGAQSRDLHVLKLLMTSDEARQFGHRLVEFAAEIENARGARH